MPSALKSAIVSSRRQKRFKPEESWIRGLRAAIARIRSQQDSLVIGSQTAGSEFFAVAAARFKIATELIPADRTTSMTDQSIVDQAVIQSADCVMALSVRPNGNIHRLLLERLSKKAGGVILIDLPGLQSDSVKSSLRDAGAVIWSPSQDEQRPWDRTASQTTGTLVPRNHLPGHWSITEFVPFPEETQANWLIHTTRACAGPWPGESFETYAGSLLESLPESDHSALGTLSRIVAQKTLLASNLMIRGGYPVVSLTACPLSKLMELHRFRSHRVRWDFEPYGIAFRREALVERGVRSVRYGDVTEWETMTNEDRPFFQLAQGKSSIDWTVEQEWRHLGDLDLADFSADDLRIIVPDSQAAKQIARIAPWPIALVPGPTDSNFEASEPICD